MARFLLALALVVATFLQAAVLSQVALLQVQPNVVLVLIVLWTLTRGPREGAFWAFGAGLFLDLVTLAPLGTHALALLGAVIVGAYSRNQRFQLGPLLPMLAVFGATIVHDALLLLVQRAGAGLLSTLSSLSLLNGLLNLLVTPFTAIFTTWLHRWLLLQEESLGRPPR